MHDLNTISRLNAEAFAESIQNYRRHGRWVLAKYEGLHLASIETFTVQSDAQLAFDLEVSKRDAGGRSVLFTPFPTESEDRKPAYDRGTARVQMLRDQSEDRPQPYTLEQLAALGRRSVGDPPDVTLNDYINRKS